jgi:4-diphosphocytidyl-2C-methyl-D-erythritol kinase
MPPLHVATAGVYAVAGPLLTGRRRSATVFARRYLAKARAGRAPYFNRLQGAAEGLEPRLRDIREKAERTFDKRFTMTGSGAGYFAEAPAGAPGPVAGFRAAGVDVMVLKVTTL